MPLFFDTSPTLPNDDALSDGEADGKEPITLNRNILQWADANLSTMPSFPIPSINFQGPNHVSIDPSLNLFFAHDGMHINPLATLKLPSTTSYTSTIPITSSHLNTLNSTTTLHQHPWISNDYPNPIPASENRALSSSATVTQTSAFSSSTTSSSHNIPRTPNLPTIVFPHVPAASARSTMHNLPTPADLLLGVDMERVEAQSLGNNLDQNLGL